MEGMGMEVLALLALVAFGAGLVDSIAGGGGLITMPALLWAGLTPVQALATNKLQSSFGSFAAALNFYRKGHFELRAMWPAVALTFAGAAAGALLVQRLDPQFLADAIPFLLVAVALYFLFQPRIGEVDRQQRLGHRGFAFSCGIGIGFYDGFFGPGTGSFFALAFVALLGFNLVKATAHTKLLNFTSNIASLLFFIIGGKVVWAVGLCMAAGQLAGAAIGSHLTMRHGGRIVRPVLVVVSIALTVKLVHSDPDHVIRQWLGF
jgi:uncharacterized protein